jgi:hypothetical protein
VASTGAVESQSLLASIDPSGAEHGGLMRKILETSKALAGNQAALGAGGADSASGVPSSTTNDAAMINLQSNRYKERAVLKQQVE